MDDRTAARRARVQARMAELAPPLTEADVVALEQEKQAREREAQRDAERNAAELVFL